MKINSNKFPDELILKDGGMRGDSRLFVVERNYRYMINAETIIMVPKGFITDGASIPRLFWNILQPYGPYFPAALIHDYLYSKDNVYKVSREIADVIFLNGMKDCGVGFFQRTMIYRAVRMCGWMARKV